jgi:putative transposase
VEASAPWRKRIRLPAAAYLEPDGVWHVTIGTANRADNVFSQSELAQEVAAVIVDRCAYHAVALEIFCLMPDHAHLLLRITRKGLVDVVGDFKSRTTRLWWKHGGSGVLWQRSFFDRGIRTAKEFDEAVTYILENPVRAGLVEDWRDYPLFGGALLDEGAPCPGVVNS